MISLSGFVQKVNLEKDNKITCNNTYLVLLQEQNNITISMIIHTWECVHILPCPFPQHFVCVVGLSTCMHRCMYACGYG